MGEPVSTGLSGSSDSGRNQVRQSEFRFNLGEGGSRKHFLIKARRHRSAWGSGSSTGLNFSADSDTSISTTQSCFSFGQVPGFSINGAINGSACEPNTKSADGQDVEKIIEVAGNLKVQNIEAAILENENVAPLAPVDEKARDANQEPVANLIIVISRILKGMPQYPHFYQLRDHSEHAKKCLKSSWDRIFEETVEQIHSLQANDFWGRARELWKTMEELQTMGYNVIPLRRRLVEMTDIITEQKLTKLKVQRLKIKAENHRIEKSRFEFEILNLQERIKKQHDGMDKALAQVAQMEKDMVKFDDVFAKLAMEELL